MGSKKKFVKTKYICIHKHSNGTEWVGIIVYDSKKACKEANKDQWFSRIISIKVELCKTV